MKAKLLAYALFLSVISTFLGLAVMKYTKSRAEVGTVDRQTQIQRLQGLENAPGVTTPAAKKMIENEVRQRTATDEVDAGLTAGK